MTTEETYSKINQNIINHVSSLYNNGNRQDILNAFSDEGSLGSTLEKLTERRNKLGLNNAITKADKDELAQINPIISRLSSFKVLKKARLVKKFLKISLLLFLIGLGKLSINFLMDQMRKRLKLLQPS